MKKNILLWVSGSRKWMGGIYYIRNILFQISLIENVKKKYNIFLCFDYSHMEEFSDLDRILELHYIERNDDKPEQLLEICDANGIDVVLPVQGGKYFWIVRDICAYWIADFQEIHLPQNFTEEQLQLRAMTNEYIARKHKCLILSSEDARSDYVMQFPQYVYNVCVMHFTSYIENLAEKLDTDFKRAVFQKFSINYQYVYVANQFWKHKNHIVVLEALDRVVRAGYKDIHLICTGYMQSYGEQTDEYVQELYLFIEQHKLENYVHFLGLLERTEQLCLMENSNLVIQPSLFEGWGCTVEDAKFFGKTILLSDIPVHKEQGDESCIFFEKDDSEQLSSTILENFYSDKKCNLEMGRRKVYRNALQYSYEFEKAIGLFENKNRENKYMQILFDKREKKIHRLFDGIEPQYIGIYGTGKHTDNLLQSYRKILGDPRFVYIDSNADKWGMIYQGAVIISPQDILAKGLKRIIISSINYQEEIYRSIKKYENRMEIIKVYEESDWYFETLW